MYQKQVEKSEKTTKDAKWARNKLGSLGLNSGSGLPTPGPSSALQKQTGQKAKHNFNAGHCLAAHRYA